MSNLAHLKIWDDPAIRGSLSWYLDVAENRRPAKFRIAATLATRCPSRTELNMSWRRARELGLKFEATTFERSNKSGTPALLEM